MQNNFNVTPNGKNHLIVNKLLMKFLQIENLLLSRIPRANLYGVVGL